MSGAMQEHSKLTAVGSGLGPVVFADFYRFGGEGGDRPLIIYVGGAVTATEYRRRLESEPVPVVEEFRRAVQSSGDPTIDLLVLPFPPVPCESFHHKLFSVLFFDLLRKTPNPRPDKIACVGYSLGASFAAYLTLTLHQVQALAVIGGYGMTEAANESRMAGGISGRGYRAFWNADSEGYMENLHFLHFLTRHDGDMDIVTANGGHDFADYAANGSVRDAFLYVLQGVL